MDLDRLDDDGGPPLVELSASTRDALDTAHQRDIAARDAALARDRAAQAAARERELAAFLAEPDPLPDEEPVASPPPEPDARAAPGRSVRGRRPGPGTSQRARVARQRAAAARDATRSWHGVEAPATPDAKAARWTAIQERDRRRDAAEQRRMLRERNRDTGTED